MNDFMEVFSHFYSHEWTYELSNIISLMNHLSPEELAMYNCHPKTIDWLAFTQLNAYGY